MPETLSGPGIGDWFVARIGATQVVRSETSTPIIGVPGLSCGRMATSLLFARRAPSRTVSSHPELPTEPIIGVPGFEPGTSATRTQRSTGLSHTPDYSGTCEADGVGLSCGRFAILATVRFAPTRAHDASRCAVCVGPNGRRRRPPRSSVLVQPTATDGVGFEPTRALAHTISNRAP